MAIHDYWILEKNSAVGAYRFNFYDKNIIEITADGLVFIWPFEPDREDLCHVCRNCPQLPDPEFAEYRKIHCQPKDSSVLPCNFAPVELIEHQDIDDYILDGGFQDGGGYFTDLSDFMYRLNIPSSAFKISHLGQFTSIRSAREKLQEYLQI